MHLFFRRYLRDIITALFLIVVGILLLINPVAFAMGLVKLAGVFLVVLGAPILRRLPEGRTFSSA